MALGEPAVFCGEESRDDCHHGLRLFDHMLWSVFDSVLDRMVDSVFASVPGVHSIVCLIACLFVFAVCSIMWLIVCLAVYSTVCSIVCLIVLRCSC